MPDQPAPDFEEARRMATFIRERWNPANTMPPMGIAELLDHLADGNESLLRELARRGDAEAMSTLRALPATESAQAEDGLDVPRNQDITWFRKQSTSEEGS